MTPVATKEKIEITPGQQSEILIPRKQQSIEMLIAGTGGKKGSLKVPVDSPGEHDYPKAGTQVTVKTFPASDGTRKVTFEAETIKP